MASGCIQIVINDNQKLNVLPDSIVLYLPSQVVPFGNVMSDHIYSQIHVLVSYRSPPSMMRSYGRDIAAWAPISSQSRSTYDWFSWASHFPPPFLLSTTVRPQYGRAIHSFNHQITKLIFYLLPASSLLFGFVLNRLFDVLGLAKQLFYRRFFGDQLQVLHDVGILGALFLVEGKRKRPSDGTCQRKVSKGDFIAH